MSERERWKHTDAQQLSVQVCVKAYKSTDNPRYFPYTSFLSIKELLCAKVWKLSLNNILVKKKENNNAEGFCVCVEGDQDDA